MTTEAVEKRLQLESYDLGANFSQLKDEYGQSKSSLYDLFTQLKTTGLEPNVWYYKAYYKINKRTIAQLKTISK